MAVRDRAGRPEALIAVLASLARHDLAPSLESMPDPLLRRILLEAPIEHLATWDRHRTIEASRIDGALRLAGGDSPSFDGVDLARRSAWLQAVARVESVLEARRVPLVVVAVPTHQRASALGCDLAALDAAVLPAIAVDTDELLARVDALLAVVAASSGITIGSPGCELTMSTAGRAWIADAGTATADGKVVNLPAGSIYTTVVEDSVEGTIRLDELSGCADVVLTFRAGRVASFAAGAGDARAIEAMFATSTGEPGRISHVGVGLNPRVGPGARGWVLVEENAAGSAYIALGENRYLGGANESSLNIDAIVTDGIVSVPGRSVVVG